MYQLQSIINYHAAVILFVLIISAATGYESYSLPDLGSSTIIDPMSLEAGFQHRFLGEIADDPFNTFLGMSRGAAVHLSLRYIIWSTVDVAAAYDAGFQEFSLNSGYSYSAKKLYLRTRIEAHYYNERVLSSGSKKPARRGGGFGQVQLQTFPLLKRIVLTGSAGFDMQDQSFGAGSGIEIRIIDPMSIYAEFFPVIQPPANSLLPHDQFPYQIGAHISTYGHQFRIFFGNATEIGARRLMKGTDGYDLHLGFQIARLFSFGKE